MNNFDFDTRGLRAEAVPQNSIETGTQVFDLEARGLRALNGTLHALPPDTNETSWEIVNPRGSHAIAVGVNAPLDITGHMSAFMAQSGNLVVLGDAGDALGDSLYEARLFVRGRVKSLGADCIEKEMRPEHLEALEDLLRRGEASAKARPEQFRRYGSARRLYNFNIDNASAY